jgi:hypothetical protein
MLSKRENEIMNAVYALCHEKGVCLVSPAELLALLPLRKNYTEESLEELLRQLALDDYFELLFSERKGEKMYVLSLRTKGQAYKRCSMQQKRDVAVKMLLAVVSAVVAFVVGLILKRIF